MRSPQYQNYVYEAEEALEEAALRRLGGRRYGAYAETDLDNPDQATNYSLRYGEQEEEEEEEQEAKPPYFRSAAEDSLKTYYTEGTPLNFSTATSVSDLRDALAREQTKHPLHPPAASKGTASPDKPTPYCVEDTPVSFFCCELF